MNPAHLLRRPAIRRAAGGQHQEEEATRKAMRTSSLVHQGQPRANSAAPALAPAPAAPPCRLPTDRSKKPQSREPSTRRVHGMRAPGKKRSSFVFPSSFPFHRGKKRGDEGKGGGGAAAGRWRARRTDQRRRG
jgi:hypothetical protein